MNNAQRRMTREAKEGICKVIFQSSEIVDTLDNVFVSLIVLDGDGISRALLRFAKNGGHLFTSGLVLATIPSCGRVGILRLTVLTLIG